MIEDDFPGRARMTPLRFNLFENICLALQLSMLIATLVFRVADMIGPMMFAVRLGLFVTGVHAGSRMMRHYMRNNPDKVLFARLWLWDEEVPGFVIRRIWAILYLIGLIGGASIGAWMGKNIYVALGAGGGVFLFLVVMAITETALIAIRNARESPNGR